ncbi:Zinc finger protein, partial [Pseudolycoriella hygida]
MVVQSVDNMTVDSEDTFDDDNLQMSRPNSAAAISERTLEECWSTLQRIFMHKSAMQMQHARDMQRGVSSVGGNLSVMGAEVKPHQCQQCLKSFSSNHQLVQHIRVHTGEKPYKCSYCDRRFKQLSHVQQHTRLHTGERPYKCHLPECGRAFIQLSNLQQHLRNHDAQVERAKNRPFHCNICGKGFATESSLRTHTSKVSHELQLHLGVLQQHAALIGGPNATSCPICHKLFLGGEALMEHMKHTHKDPNASGVATKRRTANHPCPVCGKHYVNEGSLRKHLACHPETSQLTTSLRMWPCSVCQAVFTHEGGLLTHMEHMRMDPKHQFAAQYVLSRAAAERRERDTILAAAVAVSASGSGLLGMGGGQNSMCASPSAHSDTTITAATCDKQQPNQLIPQRSDLKVS